ncbi:hypothetical protein [Actinacidiphila oryziradicis]|uniref:Uncharacterized protein n=1 Tax=Actinacidiphila oryziradicis TaxID=2571141 RepID=A0A4U0SRC1_9ACTN|nr:hypothetical protein [Actinacidiphila oryziradicis]TKA12684.1 hypothetical protein FCI23_04720 [Actinacidiphila oryziradicis]
MTERQDQDQERPYTDGTDAQAASDSRLRKRDTQVPPPPGAPGKQEPQARQAVAFSRPDARPDSRTGTTADGRKDTTADSRTGTTADARPGTRTDTSTSIREGEVRPDKPRYTPQSGQDDSARTGSRNGTAASTSNGAAANTRNSDVLLERGEGDKLGLRLQQAVGGFVDQPRKAVEEADSVLEAAAARLTEGITARRRALRAAWEGDAAKNGTEEMRIALRDYRDLVQRLLHA